MKNINLHPKKIIFLIIFLCMSILTFAQGNQFMWSTPACDFKGTFNPKKCTKKQLEDTYRFRFPNFGYFKTDALADTESEIPLLSLEDLKQEFEEKKLALASLQLLPDPYWDSLRTKMMEEVEAVYHLKKITIRAYQNPKILYEFKCSDTTVSYYQKVLNGTNAEIMEGWETLLVEQCKKNSDPDRLIKEHAEKKQSPDHLIHAKLELMIYGWWNSANHSLPHVDQDYQRSEHLFNSHFSKIRTISCEEY